MNKENLTSRIINESLGRISLIVVPLFFALSEFTHPITQDTLIGELMSAKDNSFKWLISHIFALIAILFLPFLIQKLMGYIDEIKVKSSMVGRVLSHMGIVGITGLLAYDFMLLDAWRAGDNAIVVKYLEILNTSTFGILFLVVGPIVFLLGFLILASLILISSKIEKWKAALILLGLLIYGLAGPLVPIKNGHIIVCIGALIMLIGFIGILKVEIK